MAVQHDRRIGILALQGDYEAHRQILSRIGVSSALVKHPDELADLGALIIPGGESTTHLKNFSETGFDYAIIDFSKSGRMIFGTCAGAILLATDVRNPMQPGMGLIDVTIERNAFGRQLASRIVTGDWLGGPGETPEPMEMVFIRAPALKRLGPTVRVLATIADEPVAAVQENILISTFHPELTTDTRLHDYVVRYAANRR